MRFGAVIPRVAEREFADLAVVAEEAGWDMVFSWESVWGQDAWVTLGAASMQTERLRLGTLLTPASRYRPWDLATRVASVDRLSGGRVTLGVGLGALHGNWLAFEADEGRAVRARKLDEVLAIYAGLMGGQPFEFTGEHYSATAVSELVHHRRCRPRTRLSGASVRSCPVAPASRRWSGRPAGRVSFPPSPGGALRRRDPTSPRSPSSTSWHGSAR